jgi:hypothetical protein
MCRHQRQLATAIKRRAARPIPASKRILGLTMRSEQGGALVLGTAASRCSPGAIQARRPPARRPARGGPHRPRDDHRHAGSALRLARGIVRTRHADAALGAVCVDRGCGVHRGTLFAPAACCAGTLRAMLRARPAPGALDIVLRGTRFWTSCIGRRARLTLPRRRIQPDSYACSAAGAFLRRHLSRLVALQTFAALASPGSGTAVAAAPLGRRSPRSASSIWRPWVWGLVATLSCGVPTLAALKIAAEPRRRARWFVRCRRGDHGHRVPPSAGGPSPWRVIASALVVPLLLLVPGLWTPGVDARPSTAGRSADRP